MIELDNRVAMPINEKLLNTILASLTSRNIELIITTNSHMQEINSKHRNINKPTDVLSFPYEDMPMAPLGSIVISHHFVEEKAKEFEHSNDNELTLLFIHGLLHLLGYDHEVDNGEMREKERKIIKKFHLPESLIIRTVG